MERVVHIAKNQDEAAKWSIKQALNMSHEERQAVAAVLKRKVYGNKPDIRAWHRNIKE